MKTVIMAGGMGTRIQSVRSDVPKPMIEICGKPILLHQIENLKACGLTDITIVVGHLGNVIKDFFGNGSRFGVKISYFTEETPLGTAGALFKMGLTEDFLLLCGDVIFDIDFNRFINFHREHNAWASLMVHPNGHPSDSSLIVTETLPPQEKGGLPVETGRVTAWLSKEDDRLYYRNLVNAGIEIISPELLQETKKNFIPRHPETPDKIDLDRDVLKPNIKSRKIFAYHTTEYIKDMGTPERYQETEIDMKDGKVHARNLSVKQKAVFLDRDGTINRPDGFITKPEQFELLPGVAEAVKRINRSGYLAIVVTNQPVIARGECTFRELQEIHNKMETELGKEGAYLDAIYYCPHHTDRGFAGERIEYKCDCECRKPKPGMLLQAAKDLNIDLSQSYMIGDSEKDIEAGKRAGCRESFLISTEQSLNEIVKERIIDVIDISDLWTFKIHTKKYGYVYFSRITEKFCEIKNIIEANPDNLINVLLEKAFSIERNGLLKNVKLDFNNFQKSEKNEFYKRFLTLQFYGYIKDQTISDCENLKKAMEFSKNKKKLEIQKFNYLKNERKKLSLALSGENFDFTTQKLSYPYIFNSRSECENLLNSVYSCIPRTYSSLSDALSKFNNSSGNHIAQIDSIFEPISEQIKEVKSAFQLSDKTYNAAISCIPDYYSISRIVRDDFNNIGIFVKDDSKLEYNIVNVEADSGFVKFLQDIPKGDVIKFLATLQEFPYLALADDVGKKIFDSIKSQIKKSTKKENGGFFYRARAKKRGDVDFTPVQFSELHYGVSGMGRYNFVGNPLYYVATVIDVARKEVQSEDKPESTVLKLKRIKEMNVFDISTENCPLITYCNIEKDDNNDCTAYLIPNFLASCCLYLNKKERHTVDAIKYKSSRSGNGCCYVILDKSPKEFFDDGEIVSD